jgi:hypothetical protein
VRVTGAFPVGNAREEIDAIRVPHSRAVRGLGSQENPDGLDG